MALTAVRSSRKAKCTRTGERCLIIWLPNDHRCGVGSTCTVAVTHSSWLELLRRNDRRGVGILPQTKRFLSTSNSLRMKNTATNFLRGGLLENFLRGGLQFVGAFIGSVDFQGGWLLGCLKILSFSMALLLLWSLMKFICINTSRLDTELRSDVNRVACSIIYKEREKYSES